MDYDVLYAAWRKIGADLTGLVWADFVDAIEDQIEENTKKENQHGI